MGILEQQLRALTPPDMQAFKNQQVRLAKAELTEAVKKALEQNTAEAKYFNETARPFIAKIEEARIVDLEIDSAIFKIRELFNVPEQRRGAIEDAKRITWSHIAQTVYPNEVNRI